MVNCQLTLGSKNKSQKKNYFQKFLFSFEIQNLGPVQILNQIPIPVPKKDPSSNWVFTK
jgi:hypothetical protein